MCEACIPCTCIFVCGIQVHSSFHTDVKELEYVELVMNETEPEPEVCEKVELFIVLRPVPGNIEYIDYYNESVHCFNVKT